jgi:excisionase family DNA binding protein
MNTRNPAPTPLLLSPREAAQMLAISERKLWSLAHIERAIPFVKCGRLTRYAVADLQAWINAQRRGGRP